MKLFFRSNISTMVDFYVDIMGCWFLSITIWYTVTFRGNQNQIFGGASQSCCLFSPQRPAQLWNVMRQTQRKSRNVSDAYALPITRPASFPNTSWCVILRASMDYSVLSLIDLHLFLIAFLCKSLWTVTATITVSKLCPSTDHPGCFVTSTFIDSLSWSKLNRYKSGLPRFLNVFWCRLVVFSWPPLPFFLGSPRQRFTHWFGAECLTWCNHRHGARVWGCDLMMEPRYHFFTSSKNDLIGFTCVSLDLTQLEPQSGNCISLLANHFAVSSWFPR